MSPESRRPDFAVIGGGSAGAILATRLSEDPGVSVLLVEAGPDYPTLADLPDEIKYGRATAAYVTTHGHMWSYRGRATPAQPPAPLPRGKVMGGTSSINGQVFLRGLRSDFEDWAAAGNDLWSFEAMLPRLKRIESDLDFHDRWHGDSGPIAVRRYPAQEWLAPQQAFVQACLEAGHPEAPDANRPDVRGVSPIPFNNVGGIRASTALAYLGQARRRSNLTIWSDATVHRLEVDRGRVVAMQVHRDGRVDRMPAGEFVLCGGSIGSPHLLLLSGIGPAGDLRRAGVPVAVDLPGVGRRLEDHQVVDLLWYTRPELGVPPAEAPRVQVALRYGAAGSGVADDMQITPRVHPPHLVPGGAEEGLGVMSLVPCIEQPASHGEISLRSVDPSVQPEIELRFLTEEVDRRRLREGVRLCLELAASPPFAALLGRRIVPGDGELASDAELDGWLQRNVRTSHHSACSCHMGPDSDPEAVVDQQCRVRGLDNLRVVDASVFPREVRANTAVTVMALAERAADLIRAPAGASAARA